MKILLAISLTSLIVIFLMIFLNSASYKDKNIAKEKVTNNQQ